MYLNTFALLSLVAIPSTFAMNMSNSTVPEACKAICNPVIELVNTCNPMTGMEMSRRAMVMTPAEEEKAELDCICSNKSFDVKTIMGLCASCMGQNDASGVGNKTEKNTAFLSNFLLSNDMSRVMSKCSFPTTSYAPSATSILKGVSVQATKPAMTMVASNSTTSSSASMGTNMAGMGGMGQIGASGRVEVATSVWGVGMLMVSMGLGAGLLFGML